MALAVSLIHCETVLAVEDNLETSIVSLIIKSSQAAIAKDDYFELIDYGEYQLVPINSLARWLELEIGFDRAQNTLTVYSLRCGRKVSVYVNERQYRVEGRSEWGTQPPVALNGSFYISTLLLEYVAQVKVTWASRYQELTIQGDWLSPGVTDKPQLSAKTETETQAVAKALEGPALSLGMIAYGLSWEKIKDSSGNETAAGVLDIRSDGRAGPWTLSLGNELTYEYGNRPIDPTLALIRAQYDENNQLIVLGDSEVNLDETLGTKEFRGILWMSPNLKLRKKSLAYTTVSGIADPGDQVRLWVNDQFTSELSVHEGNSYAFANVPLIPGRINGIKVVITKRNGETVESCRKVAACPRMMEGGDWDFLLAYGDYRQALLDPWGNVLMDESGRNHRAAAISWEGNVTAFKADYGLNDHITLNSEIVRIRPVNFSDQAPGIIDGASLGVALRAGPGMIYTLDWLVGGAENMSPVQSGFSSSLLYEMENGSFQVAASYVPDEAGQGLRNVCTGKSIRFLGEMDCASGIDYKIDGNLVESVSIPANAYGEIGFTVNRHSGTETLVDHSLTITRKNSSTLSQRQNLSEITWGYWKRGAGFASKETLDFSNLALGDQSSPAAQSLSFEENIVKSFNSAVLFGFSFHPALNWRDTHYHDLTVSAESELKWSHNNTRVAVSGMVTGISEAGAGAGSAFQLITAELGGYAGYYWAQSGSCYLKYSRTIQPLDGECYSSGETGLTYQWPKKAGRIWAYLGYASPVGGFREPQWSHSLGISKTFGPGLELILETERNYDSLWSGSFKQVYRLSFRQALGFGNGRVRTFPYAAGENPTLIGGTVYLDENGNRRRDPGEKGLANVRMMLDGSVAETDQDGNYLFNTVEPGMYRVNFDFKSLPADYTPVTGEQLLKIKPSETMFLDFGVTLNGSIAGKVFRDTNADGRLDAGEEPLSWAGILLDGVKKYFTVQDGSFYIEHLPLGTHTISIIPETVPPGMEVKGSGAYQVDIGEQNLDVTGILFPVVFEFKE